MEGKEQNRKKKKKHRMERLNKTKWNKERIETN